MREHFLEKYLIGDVSKLDQNDSKIQAFIVEVMTDFFLSKINSNKE